MSEATSIKAKVYMGNKRRSKVQRMLTFEIICEWIKLQGFDEYTTHGLIELAAKYPTQALPSFRKNFNLMIERVRQKRKFEQEGQVFQKKEETNAKDSQKVQTKETGCQAQACQAAGQIQGQCTGEQCSQGEDSCDADGDQD